MQDFLLPIETPRLIIRLPTIEDLPSVHAAKLEQWDSLSLWMPWAMESLKILEATEDFIKGNLKPTYENGDLKEIGCVDICYAS